MRNFWKIVFCLALLALSGASASAIGIGRTTPPEFWVDSNNNTDYNCNYVCYAITNNDGVSYNSVWVTIGSFGGGVVTLAPSEDGQVNLGPMANGEVKYAYFFLRALTKTGPAQTHTITVYNGLPSLNISLGSTGFSLTLEGIISASANKVTAVVTGPTPPTLGGIVTITVDGDSGTISSTRRWSFSAASLGTWDPGAYELYETIVTLSLCNCPNDGLRYTNTFNFITPDNKDTHWQAVYKLRAVNTTLTPTAVTPIADISSGGANMKYTTPSTTPFSPIAISTNGLILVSDSVNCGGVSATATNVTYTLTLSNSAPNDAYMDAFVVTLTGSPTNATYVNNSSKTNNVSYANPTITGTSSNQTLTWSGYFLVPANGTRNLSFQAAIPAVFGGYTNSAYATIGTNRIDTTLSLGDSAPAICTYTIAPLADVQTTKSGPTNVFAGTNFTYTLSVTNIGPSSSSNLIVVDQLPTNVAFVSASSGGFLTNGQVKWTNLLVFTNTQSTNFMVTVTAPANAGVVTNVALNTATTADPATNNNNGLATNAIVTTTIAAQTDLKVTKSGTNNVFAGTNFSYTITLTNMGPSTASSIIVTDTLPTGVIFSNATAGYTLTNGLLTWPIGSLTNGGATNLTVTVIAPNDPTTLTNIASAGGIDFDPVSTNNNGTATNSFVITTVTPQADLKATKSGTNNVFAGTNFSYTITLTNIGPSTASSITVTDVLPAGVTVSNATAGYTFTNGLLTWPVASLTNGGVTNFSVTVIAPSNAVTLTNRVLAGGIEFDPTSTNNNGTATNAIVTTTVIPQADLQITKTGTNNVFAGTNFSYSITLTNMGPSTASSITITDTLPVGVTFSNATAGYTLTNGLLMWSIASLTNGGVTNFSVTVIAPADSATLTNRVSAGGVEFDPVLTNNDGTSTNATVTTTVTPQADLRTTKSGLTNVFAGTNFSYTINLTNMGPSLATSVMVTDALPSSVIFVTATPGFTFTNGLVTWPIATFTNGATTNFSITVTAPASGSVTNIASSGSSVFDPAPTNNNGTAANAIVTTDITPQANLQVTKSGPTNVFAATNFSYTITLTNLGPSTATSIVVTDALPFGVTFVTASAGFTFTNGFVTWPIASFTNGAVTNFSLTVTAPSNASSLTNIASGGSATFDPVVLNNDGSTVPARVITTVTSLADIQTTKSGPTNVFAGTNFSYTITLTNMGPSTAANLSITDALPAGVTFVSASPGAIVSSNFVAWQIASFTNAASTNFTITVTAPSDIATLTNVVFSASDTADLVSANNNGSAAAATVVTAITPQADLVTVKTGPANVLAGTNFSYTVTLTNFGPSMATSIAVTDALPMEVNFVSASGGGTFTNGLITWSVVSLAKSAVTNFTVTVTSPPEGTVTNRVSSGSSIFDPVLVNNDGTAANAIVTTLITPQADLQATKSGPATVFAATNFSYTITLTNLGPSTATSLVVTDALPTGVTFVTASTGFAFTNGFVTWSIASFTNGANTNFSVTVTAPPEGTLTNRVTAGGSTIDPVVGNNNGTATNSTVTTIVIPQADLKATKIGPATAFAGTNFNYTITLTNIGPSTATSLVVTDALPAGVTFVTASGGYTFTNGLVTWPISSFPSGGVTNFSITVTAPSSGTLTNRALTGSATFDPVALNNDGTATNATAITTVIPLADVQATKTGPLAKGAGTNIVYTISITNAGPSTASNIVVVDTLPAGVSVISASHGGVATTNNVTWPALVLANGESTNFTLTITAATGPITNIVSSTADTLDPVPGNNDGSTAAARVVTAIAVGVNVSGFVYSDANQNGFKDGAEAGTGLALFAKIFPSAQAAGPAIQAIIVNPATGGYTFSNIATGTYIIVVDDNNTLADVTPNLPSGWTGLEQPAQIRNNIPVGNTPVGNQNFGLVQAVTLKGTVFNDNGLTSGTANDGIKNGGEIGIAGAIVKLTDSSGATVYATANTASDGSFTLLIPGSVTNGVTLKLVEINVNGYRSTGASVGNTAGTYERTNDVVTFTYAAGTLYTEVNFGDVPPNEFTTDGQQQGLPGSTVVYSHTFTAGSVGAVTFTTTKVSTPNIPGWNAVIYRDNNCNAQLDSADTVVAGAISVAADQKICLVVKEFIPAGAPFNAQDQVTISAAFAYANAAPALSASATRVDLTTVGNPTTAGLSLLKEVDKASAAPGEVITYTISYVNSSSGSLSNIIIFDATPAFTKFLSATNGVMGAGLDSVNIVGPNPGDSGSVKWTFSGALIPTGSGNVIYKVTIE